MDMTYNLEEVPPDIRVDVMTLARKKFSDPGSVLIQIGTRTLVRTSVKKVPGIPLWAINKRFRTRTTVVQLNLNHLIRISKKSIPFDQIPLHINRPNLFPIEKMILEKRLDLGE